MALGPYLWFGGKPGKPPPRIAQYGVAKHQLVLALFGPKRGKGSASPKTRRKRRQPSTWRHSARSQQ